jgi:hypothetical protein
MADTLPRSITTSISSPLKPCHCLPLPIIMMYRAPETI